MRDPPSGRVPEQGPDWFLVATEACGGRTLDLGYVLEVWGFIGEVGVENKSGGPTGSPRGTGARPPPLWGPQDSPPVDFCSSIFYSFQKNSPLIFIAFREFLFVHKNNTTVVLLKTASVRVSSNQIIPKSYKTIVNMA